MMELYPRCHHWTVLQMVAIVLCYRGRTLSAERAQGCVWSQLTLRCPEMRVIQITSVVLGDTYCNGDSCCIEDSDCTYAANDNHRTGVHRRCNNEKSCTVGVLREKIPCGYWGVWNNNDFERITYNCINDPQRSTTTKFSRSTSTQNSWRPKGNTPEKETINDDISSSTVGQNNEVTYHNASVNDKHDGAQEDLPENQLTLPVVMATVCILLLIAIVIVVVMMKRKRWTKVGETVRMTDLDGSNRKEAIYANEDQTMSQNHVKDSPIYSNHKIKKSRNKGKKSTKKDEVPSNAAHSLADEAGSRLTEDPNNYCNSDSREPVYQVPRSRSNVYSLARDVGESECAGSTADASIVDNTVYCEVEFRKQDEATNNSSAQNVYDEACNINESEYDAVKSDKSLYPTQKNQKKKKKKKETDNPSHKIASDSNTKVDKPSRNVATSEASDKVASKDKVDTSNGHPNPIYEEMSPAIPESMYANATVLSPNSSVASRAIPTGGGSVADNSYCEMK